MSPGWHRAWPMFCAAFVFAVGFVAITTFVFTGSGAVAPEADDFDRTIEQLLQQFRSPALTGRVVEISALGSAPVLSLLALLAYSVILRARDRLGFVHLSVALLGAAVWSRLLQHLFDRARPDTLLPFLVVTEGSYPSAHLLGASACYLTFAFFYARYTLRSGSAMGCYLVAFVVILLIGATRIYLGAHHATDVMAGICAGAAWGLVVATIVSLWYGEPPVRP